MKVRIDTNIKKGPYRDPTCWQNSTLRYAPPLDFPAYLEEKLGRAKIMRVWITLDEYWDYRTNTYEPDYDIGVKRYPDSELHYLYDWKNIVPAPAGTRFRDYLTSHAQHAEELLLNVRRLEREVLDGVIGFDQYEQVFEKAVEYCKELAPNLRYVEVCNEIELRAFGQINGEEYAKLYLCAYRAVKRLNQKHNYEMPLAVGGYGVAHPLVEWTVWETAMEHLLQSGIGDAPMDFYSYHHYDYWEVRRAAEAGHPEIGEEYTPVTRLALIMERHRDMLKRLSLPERPVLLNELGKAACSELAAVCLENAAELLTYLIAWDSPVFRDAAFFPWCTFHNPKLQTSYTQFLLREDGTYAATPNGIAMEMLHSLGGERLGTEVTEATGKDAEYRAVAAGQDGTYRVVCTNPTDCPVPLTVVLEGAPCGQYRLREYLCDATHNNAVTGYGNGDLVPRRQAEVTDGMWHTVLEANGFVLLEWEPA